MFFAVLTIPMTRHFKINYNFVLTQFISVQISLYFEFNILSSTELGKSNQDKLLNLTILRSQRQLNLFLLSNAILKPSR